MAGQYWRAAGITYLQYANICGTHVRNCLKEPFRAAAKNREGFISNTVMYQNGKESSTIILNSELLQKELLVKKN
ncbi:ATP synthase epsilon chain, mitochondrial [Dictyostelium discoideum AX4]|uniref:ATP synthase F(1) complex subunit epsilon, mitochondrial n=1 Tax=Dictyostelium discoideum TaxID=44689 RepID=ATP5E_DICDI|nr:ATP synthase epsilon chain, mitochondrial [Dictyostelium discoideum AX4]Q75JK6.1 RecName: Full=ATP synthase subunit epsilon, mitochondrial; Short=ATPase subunit epsilon; AltName: Full=ATP synthase F1 subunit epsilon [Dictyostelium discoideum]EAS66911.1 ATP synthase epsilon chain, mitochondrial [Dictyostelium discoideum AX4]|eukprot:XP_001134595.1 ATP synthase epsilon chain, mitochondrial [Dictyostelium discoideum AX4]